MKITEKVLVDLRAFSSQVDLFVETFPRGCTVTIKNLEKAGKAGLDINWLANEIFKGVYREAYQAAERPAEEAYQAAKRPAYEAYQAATRPAFMMVVNMMDGKVKINEG